MTAPGDEVAERLGYSEASSFVHAFKRWKGVAPGAYRQRPSGGDTNRGTKRSTPPSSRTAREPG